MTIIEIVPTDESNPIVETKAERPSDGFASLGLNKGLVDAVTALGYEEPTSIQREAIPSLIAGRDILGQAATGTGKTAAFALPLLQRLSATPLDHNGVRGLILVPTRELAMQVAQAVHAYGKSMGCRVLPIYGGQSMKLQLRALERGVDIAVATPGRALDHLQCGTLKLDHTEMVILDEADEMLDMGFAEDLEAILSRLPASRQTALFSATLPKKIVAIANRHLQNPVRVTIANTPTPKDEKARVREVAYSVPRNHKMTALSRVLDMENPTAVIIFCRTRTEVDEISATFSAHGYEASALHGGLSQELRDRVLSNFRDGTSDILVATDVAARGLDIDHVSHVVNYEVPSSPDIYIHRIGRTGRAGREGVAITFADAREIRLLRNIESHTKRKIPIESVPTVYELQERRLEQTRTTLEDKIKEGKSERFRRVIEDLGTEYDVIDIAAAALALFDATLQSLGDENTEIPNFSPGGIVRADKPGSGKPAFGRDLEAVKLYVNAGRRHGIGPGDLVGAIANMAQISSGSIGTITMSDRFSLVEIPIAHVEKVLKVMRSAIIRGQKISIRRDREV